MHCCRRPSAHAAAIPAAARTPRPLLGARPTSINVHRAERRRSQPSLFCSSARRARSIPRTASRRRRRSLQIDESRCIGCAKCLPPCPVDAILGSARHMHTVLVELCTGCELCIAPCPVDCIAMVAASALPRAPAAPSPALNRRRFEARNGRIARQAEERTALLEARKRAAHLDAAAASPAPRA